MANRVLELLLKISADSGQAQRAIKDVSGGLDDIKRRVAQAFTAGALIEATRRAVQTADAYNLMAARLKIVTNSAAEFARVQSALGQVADRTRSGLAETVELYTRLGPAFRELGVSSDRAVGVVQTVSQLIQLSGASAAQASAAVLQFSQALGSGTLQGDELRSLRENAPGLMQALAEGLGVPIGKLKEMGEQGKLTSAVVIAALEKMRDKTQKDFDSLPASVSAATTRLGNAWTAYIASSDKALGATQSVAGAINAIADNLPRLAEIGLLAAGLFAFGRVAAMIGTAVVAAGRFAVVLRGIAALFGGPVGIIAAGALAWASVIKQLAATEDASKQSTDAQAKHAQELADKLKDLDGQREKKLQELAQLETDLSRQAAEGVKKDTKEKLQAEVEAQEKIVEAVRRSFQEQLDSIRQLKEEAQTLRDAAGQTRADTAARQRDIARRGLTPEEQQRDIAAEAEDVRSTAAQAQARATIARVRGDFKAAEKAAEEAIRQAERAQTLAERLTDNRQAADLVGRAGAEKAAAQDEQAKIKEAQAKLTEEVAQGQREKLQELEAKLTDLRENLATFEIRADIVKAMNAVQQLGVEAQRVRDQMERPMRINIDASQMQAIAGQLSGFAALPLPDAQGNTLYVQSRAVGGPIRGPGHDTSDNLLALLSPNEWVIRAASARHYGDAFMRAINERRLPRFAAGGLVSRFTPPATPVAAGGAGGGTPINLHWPSGQVFPLSAPHDVGAQLVDTFRREALKAGRR